MLYFIIVVVLLLSHLHCVIENVTCTIGFHGGHIFSKTEMDSYCIVIGQHHCVSCDFIENLENSGACDVSAARMLSYTVPVASSFESFFVVHRFSTFAVFNPLTLLLALIVSPTVRDNTPHCSFYCLLSFGLLLVTMSSLTSSSQRNRITCFPGDPRYAAIKLTATAAEFSRLSRKEFLSMAVLDSILQHTALPQDNASEEIIPPMIGSLGCDTWMTASNYNASLTRKEVEIKQSGSAVNILSLSFAISSPVSSMLRLLPITHKDSSFQWYHHRV